MYTFQGSYYHWTVCPSGLNSSPFYFNKILCLVTTFLRQQGIIVVLYVDDFLVTAQPSLIVDHRSFVIQTLGEVGFMINFDKCRLIPSNLAEFIGFISYIPLVQVTNHGYI